MTEGGIGEKRSRARRRSWWIAAIVYTGSAAIAGLLARRLLLAPHDQATMPSPAAVSAWVAIAVAGYVGGCWLYLRAIDEVEVRDNLFGAATGLYAYAIAMPTWWLLWRGGAAPEPNAWAIYLGSLGVAAAVYLVRRATSHI